ncbi:Leucine-rich repeat and calponin homology domain-containing protein 3 [Trichinella pseudospiralis]|uniref:Leucine-rich repeat and calponin homology domain-containing protein 3 n=1 Tax=Trichinella pseudospiralis TaxID=6337 RepID=A0A0V1JU20_TRIPS|nr:Leucine-rich repeat and calponin homology domain-containing protein 3 [Trichinella pseudospiralis]
MLIPSELHSAESTAPLCAFTIFSTRPLFEITAILPKIIILRGRTRTQRDWIPAFGKRCNCARVIFNHSPQAQLAVVTAVCEILFCGQFPNASAQLHLCRAVRCHGNLPPVLHTVTRNTVSRFEQRSCATGDRSAALCDISKPTAKGRIWDTMAAFGPCGDGSSTGTMSRCLDKVFEDAQLAGVLFLSGRNLKTFPCSAGRYDLSDTVYADLSKNRLAEFPVELAECGFLETLHLQQNCIRSVPNCVRYLGLLTYLDLSVNQIQTFPVELCLLPLEVLLLNNNRIESLPVEIEKLSNSLAELDLSCNQIAVLPNEIGALKKLRVLNLRQNLLTWLPYEFCNLELKILDVSYNKLSHLDVDLRFMRSVVHLSLDGNPLVFPMAMFCDRGRDHVFRILELEAVKRGKAKQAGADVDTRQIALLPTNPNDYKYLSRDKSGRRQSRNRTIATDSGYSTLSEEHAKMLVECLPFGAKVTAGESTLPLARKRSPPVGQEAVPLCAGAGKRDSAGCRPNFVPPPPPLTAFTSCTLLQSVKKSERGGLVEEVMSACLERMSLGSSVVDETTSTPDPVVVNGRCTPDKKRPPPPPPPPPRKSPEPIASHRNAVVGQQQHCFKKMPAMEEACRSSPVGEEVLSRATPPKHVKSEIIQALYTTAAGAGGGPLKAGVAKNTQSVYNDGSPQLGQSPSKLPTILATVEQQHCLSPLIATVATVDNANQLTSQQKKQQTTNSISCNGRLEATEISAANHSNNNNSNVVRRLSYTKNQQPNRTTINHPAVRSTHNRNNNNTVASTVDSPVTVVESIRKIVEQKLDVDLPHSAEALGNVLSDGVLLCNFINAIRPRTVAIVHTSADTGAKLPLAKARRNVENFLTGCRRLGVQEDWMPRYEDLVLRHPPDLKSLHELLGTLVQLCRLNRTEHALSFGRHLFLLGCCAIILATALRAFNIFL